MLRPAFSSDLHTADMPTTFLSQADIEEGLIGERELDKNDLGAARSVEG